MFSRAIPLPSQRLAQWLGFYAAILLAWVTIYQLSRGESWICGPGDLRLLPFGGFWALYPMWLVMIAAMMLPTLVPALRVYDDLPARAGATDAGWFGIVVGYALVWALGSASFAGAQVWMLDNGVLDLTGVVASPWMAAGLFALAGAYQFSKLKEACQNGCLTPMQYFITRWQPGAIGGTRMGVGLGAMCVGCCWAIMALGFVGGMTSLLWMGAATAFMVAEKLPQIGRHIRLPAGVGLLGTSLVIGLQALGGA